ncbi:MAG: hypothetical protein NTZ06_03155 [Actinobacteria bacterium]|nr:hypothetical protein [Actinomycetota bacterium]
MRDFLLVKIVPSTQLGSQLFATYFPVPSAPSLFHCVHSTSQIPTPPSAQNLSKASGL